MLLKIGDITRGMNDHAELARKVSTFHRDSYAAAEKSTVTRATLAQHLAGQDFNLQWRPRFAALTRLVNRFLHGPQKPRAVRGFALQPSSFARSEPQLPKAIAV